jgi:hypothetical protein
MLGGQRSWVLFFLLTGLAACGRTPLEDQAPSTTPSARSGPISNGSIKVTLYNNNLANGAGQVDLLLPDGSKRSQGASPSCVFSGLTQAGTYTACYQNQPSAAPSGVTATLSTLSPTASVGLQVGSGSLVLTPVSAQPLGFDFDTTTFFYTVQFTSAAGAAQDVQLDLLPSSVPPGWSYHFNPPLMRGSGTGILSVSSAVGCTSTSLTLQARANVGTASPATASFSVTRHWSLGLSAVWLNLVCPPFKPAAQQYAVRVTAIGIPSGSPVTLLVLPTLQNWTMEFSTATTGSGTYGPFTLWANDVAVTAFVYDSANILPCNVTLNYLTYSVIVKFPGHP